MVCHEANLTRESLRKYLAPLLLLTYPTTLTAVHSNHSPTTRAPVCRVPHQPPHHPPTHPSLPARTLRARTGRGCLAGFDARRRLACWTFEVNSRETETPATETTDGDWDDGTAESAATSLVTTLRGSGRWVVVGGAGSSVQAPDPPSSVPEECPTRLSDKSVLREFFARATHKSVPEECPRRVFRRPILCLDHVRFVVGTRRRGSSVRTVQGWTSDAARSLCFFVGDDKRPRKGTT